jgi:hypothetical protein
VLEAKCYTCHGPKKQESDLRLDLRDRAFKGGSGGVVLVEGKPEESALIDRVESEEPDYAMPPRGKGERLTPQEVTLIKDWIRAGAKWPEDSGSTQANSTHWAFIPPGQQPVPDVQDATRALTPIDRFILARLERARLTYAPEADRRTLARRLYLDLIGLPPAPEAIDQIAADPRPDAIERLTDGLLGSPHFGERWGRHWLDAARYADSDGFEKDKPRYIYAYRDWVIDAHNRDLPYDRFVIEQLAGDLLPSPSQDQLVATGFLRNSMVNEEGGVDPEQFRMEAMFDRMDAIGKSILGLTIQCAQCHSHKFDPISQDEYYRMFSYLNNDDEPARVIYTPAEQQKISEIQRNTTEVERMLRERTPDWEDRLVKLATASLAAPRTNWTTLQAPFEEISTGGQKYLPQTDGSYLAQGYAPTKHTAKVSIKTDVRPVRAVRLELLNDPNLPAHGPGRSFKGTCALTDLVVEAAPASDPSKKERIKIRAAFADYEQPEAELEPNFDDKSKRRRVTGPIAFAFDDKEETAWGIDAGPGRRNVPREAVFVLEKPVDFDGGAILTFGLAQNHGGWNSDDLMTNNLGRFRLSVTDSAEAKLDPLPARVRQRLEGKSDLTAAIASDPAVFSHFRSQMPEWRDANLSIESFWKSHPEGATTLVLEARSSPRTTSVLRRGDFLAPTRAVGPGVPAVLNSAPADDAGNRLSLAQWLTDRRAPTTARVIVNRIWQSYFGTGLVGTPEDLGTQGEPPSHPELLDWLAVEFMEQGWSMKWLHRMITRSSVYRQSSAVTPEHYARDPANRLLARGARFRVEGEIVRDIQLAASGLLVPSFGGKAVMPPAPAYLFQPPASYAPFPWIEETGPNRYRRAVYTWRRRSTPYPMLATFDVPPGETACVRRARSNTPLQALTTLNETLALEAARSLAIVMLAEGGSTDGDRLTQGFKRCVGRAPSASELDVLTHLLEKQTRRLEEGWLNAWEIATGQAAERPRSLPVGATPTQAAAFTLVARVLLNLDETLTKQ